MLNKLSINVYINKYNYKYEYVQIYDSYLYLFV